MTSIGDLMFAFATWLKTTPLPAFSLWLSNTEFSATIDRNFWAIPTIQTIHILAIAAVFGSVVMINLRIFRLAGRSSTMIQTTQRFLPWVWWGLVVLAATGVGLVIGEPTRELLNPAFWTKMVLVAVAALASLWFQGSVRRHVDRWTITQDGRIAVRAGAAASIGLWCVIMVLGRWIAYAPT